MSAPTSINLRIDSGTNNHFHDIGSTKLQLQPTSNYNPSAQAIVPNGASVVYSINTNLPIPSLPPYAKKSHVLIHIESGYLFSVGKPCNHNSSTIFDKQSIKIFKSKEVSINVFRPPIVQGHRITTSLFGKFTR